MAALLQVLQAATAAGFVAIGALALKDWLGRRDPGRGYLALAVGCLGIVSAMGRLTPELPPSLRWAFSDLSLAIFLMSGLALLLFRDTVIPLGRRVKTSAVAITGVVAVAAAAVQLPSGTSPQYSPLQYGVVLALVLVWCLSVGEPSVRMWLVSRHQPAVQQARLRALSVGYGGIVAILLSAVFAGSAATAPAVQLGFALAALAMVPVLYAGFAPPGWLRRVWRRREEELFQQATRDLLIFSPDTTTLATKALEWALRMAGAKQGFIAFPQTTIIARHAIAAEEAARFCGEIGNQAGIRLLRSGRGATQTAIASPLVTGKATGMLVLLAGPFTPVFGADEVSWIGQYATLMATGLERVALVEEMAGLNQELAGTVGKITAQKAELEAANRELEAYSYTVSHDLRAPLRAINGFTAILFDEHAAELSEAAKDYLGRVHESGKHMGELVDDLLAFSRLGRQPMRKQSVNTTEVAGNAWTQVSEGLEGRQVTIHIGDLPICESDPILLEQVFVNLLSNAVKYSRPREVALIDVAAEVKAGQTIYSVRDNGVGFDMQYADRLFRVFQRLHRADEYEGTGVGLATVHRIVERHGGRVWAEAAPGKGATFYFTLKGAPEWQAAAA
ncbi:MAG TPA: ATP-binding protein [Candidatus Eisenbacteria bacterium]|nr:ATP-binding protein [Candidatus Eisenbacteria bacterium]